MMITLEQDLEVRIEESKSIYVGEAARNAIREDARAALDQRLCAARDRWDGLDLESLRDLRALKFELASALACADALLYLAPIPD